MMISAQPKLSMAVRFLAAAALCATPLSAARSADPMRFFEGRTESAGVVKIIAKKPFNSRAMGKGEIKPDGTLIFVQRVVDDGKAPFDRVWRIHGDGPGRWLGTMTEAKGPVAIDDQGGKYRFRFKMKGNVQVEQWLIPNRDWKSAVTKVTIKKFGMIVGRSEGTIKKLD